MSFSDNFTDEDLCSQLRMQFDIDEQWDIDFTTVFQYIIDRGVDFYLEFRGRKFSIDKLTGGVSEV